MHSRTEDAIARDSQKLAWTCHIEGLIVVHVTLASVDATRIVDVVESQGER